MCPSRPQRRATRRPSRAWNWRVWAANCSRWSATSGFKKPKNRLGRNRGGSTSQTLQVIEAVPQECPHVINTQGTHYEVPRTSCKLRHTRPSKRWALPPAHLPEHVSLWTRVNASFEVAGLVVLPHQSGTDY